MTQIIAQTHFFERDTPPSIFEYLMLVANAGDWFNAHQTMDGFTYPPRDTPWWEMVNPGMRVRAGPRLPVYAIPHPEFKYPFLNSDGTPKVYTDGRALDVAQRFGPWFLVWVELSPSDPTKQRGMWAHAKDCAGVAVFG